MTNLRDIIRGLLLADLPDGFRVRDVGTAPADGRLAMVARCQCIALVVRVDDPRDPFGGRTPTVAELDRLFGRDGDARTAYAPTRPAPSLVDLRLGRYYVDGRPGAMYVGQCPDCGVVLYAEVARAR